MNLFKILSATSLLWLAGCATTSLPDTTKPTETTATKSAPSRWFNTEVKPAIPGGDLQPITSAQLRSASVVALAPPPDLWERIRSGYAMPDLSNDLVTDREQWYSTRPDYILRMTERSRKYMFHIVEELERRNMPSELALLPFIESAFNPQAVSSAKAAGMWQFMPATGKYFELKQNMFRDDRRDVLASTKAALDYLQKLHRMFGDWHLALAAYNWGEGSVSRAIAKNKRAGLGTAYTDLTMPMETRMYVPKLQAVKNIVARPQAFNSSLPMIGNHPFFETVDIKRDIDVALAAKLAEVSLADFKALNPSISRPIIMAAGTPQILLPWDNASVFQSNLEAYAGGQLASWTVWVAPTTMKTADAAQRVGMSETELRSVNNIPPRVLIKAGSSLLVHRSQRLETDVSEHAADYGQLSLAPEIILKRRVLKAGKKDTVASLARRYAISAQSVADWNKTSASAKFKPGQQIVLFLPASTRAAAPEPKAANAKAGPTRAKAKSTAKAKTGKSQARAKPAKPAKASKVVKN
jgi:membrane-bound lytic murein transglycosylase D